MTVDAAAFAEALRQVVPAASRDDARPILTGVLLTAHGGGLRLVATDSYRLAVRDLAGREHARRRARRCWSRPRASPRCSGSLGDGEIEVVLGEREVMFRVGRAEVTTRLIEGDFPNYEQLIPSGYPNRLTVARDALEAAVDRVQIVGQSRDTAADPARDERPTASSCRPSAQDVGEAHEAVEAKFEGTRAHRRVQPAVPARRHRRASRASEVALEIDRPAEAGGAARRPTPATSCTC